MKKVFEIGIVLILVLVIVFFYLLFKVWTVFGFWTCLWTGLVSTISSFYFDSYFGSRKETPEGILYNPRELPKFFSLVILGSLAYYLYNRLDQPGLSQADRTFGIAYLGLTSLLPMLWVLYKLVRDRNDFILITPDLIKYRDNDTRESIPVALIKKVMGGSNIYLNMTDGTEKTIPASRMNFGSTDLAGVIADIRNLLPEEKSEELLEGAQDQPVA